jgi:transglutaminase-like putative cysteine protease
MSSSSRSCVPSECLARAARGACVLLAALLACAPALAADAERWYRLALDGRDCGWMVERIAERPDGTVRTETESLMRMGRMGQAIEVRSRSAFEERADGTPLRVEGERGSGADAVRSSWSFDGAQIAIEQRQGGRVTTQRVAAPAPGWLSPAAADRRVRAAELAGEATVEFRTVDPEHGPTEMRVRRTRVGPETVDLGGRPVAAVAWRTELSILDRPGTDWVDASGTVVRSRVDLGVGVLESTLVDRAAATAAIVPVEVMSRTFIAAGGDGRRLPQATCAVLRVRARDGSLGDLPTAGAQRVERTGADAATVSIDAAAGSAASDAERADPRFLAASATADCDDAAIRAFAERAAAGPTSAPAPGDAAVRAEALRRAVHRHITRKNLASGLATASQALATRAGDCTEHAVLLVAALRAQRIPARVASGLAYVDAPGHPNSFGWHMWTQAIVDGRWIDLDATLPADGPRFRASRLLTGTSAADGASMDADLSAIVNLIGDLAIAVESVDGGTAKP